MSKRVISAEARGLHSTVAEPGAQQLPETLPEGFSEPEAVRHRSTAPKTCAVAISGSSA